MSLWSHRTVLLAGSALLFAGAAMGQRATEFDSPDRTRAALAQALAKLLDDAPLRASLASDGRQRAEAQFSLPAIASQLRSIYEAAILLDSPKSLR